MRELVRGMCSDWAVSIRTACGALRFDRSSFHYKSRRADQAPVERRIREICETRVRYGYRRVHALLRREGWEINMKKTRRIYSELGLQLRNKHPRRRVKAKLREDRQEAVGPNDVWAMDFVHDQLATGRKLRMLTIVDTHSRFCPATDPRFTYRGEDVVQTRSSGSAGRAAIQRRSGSTMEASSSRATSICGPAQTTSRWTSPGQESPRTTGSSAARQRMLACARGKAFNSKLRSECLNAHRFLTLADAREKLETWRREYNEVRPHSAIGYNVPIDIHNPGGATSPLP